jgi:hypothetical protein
MKLFPQLALVSAIAVSGSAFAMEALNDATLSNTTGQDGITIAIKPPTKNFDAKINPTTGTGTSYFTATGGQAGVIDIDSVRIHDKDGEASLGFGTTGDAGAIVLDGFSLAGSAPIIVKIDADGNAGAPVLNVNVALPQTLVIRTGDISVAESNGIGAALGNQVKVLDSMDIKMGAATLNIQLGNEVQGAMIKVAGTIDGGLVIDNFKLNDADDGTGTGTAGGSIGIDKLTLIDNAGTVLTLASNIDVVAGGLQITSTATNKLDVRMQDVRLGDFTAGSPASIGDVELVGIDTNGTVLTISGH